MEQAQQIFKRSLCSHSPDALMVSSPVHLPALESLQAANVRVMTQLTSSPHPRPNPQTRIKPYMKSMFEEFCVEEGFAQNHRVLFWGLEVTIGSKPSFGRLGK